MFIWLSYEIKQLWVHVHFTCHYKGCYIIISYNPKIQPWHLEPFILYYMSVKYNISVI